MSRGRGSPRRAPAGRQPGAGPRTVEEISAGGVVVRGDEVLVVVPTRRAAACSSVSSPSRWPLGSASTREPLAAREVREEGGVEAELVGPLGEVRYHYRRSGRLISKRVRFFLFNFRSGSPADHDHEIEDARWVPMAQAAQELTYPGEREMVLSALSKTGADR